jgi:hypothetical protein
MRAFEFQDRSYLLESVSTEVTKLGTLLDKSVEQDKPEVTKEIGQTIKAMLDATNKMVAVIKDSKKAPQTKKTTTQPNANKFKPITPPSQQDQRLAASQAYAQKPVESLDEEVSAQLSDADVASLEKDIDLMEDNLKFIREMMPKTDPKVVAKIKEMETILGRMNNKHEQALKTAEFTQRKARREKENPAIAELAGKVTGTLEAIEAHYKKQAELAKNETGEEATEIVIKEAPPMDAVTKEIVTIMDGTLEGLRDDPETADEYNALNKKILEFLKASKKGVVPLADLLNKGSGNIIDEVDDGKWGMLKENGFIKSLMAMKPAGSGAGSWGPGEVGLAVLGTPVNKMGKGDLNVGGKKFELKASASPKSGGRINASKAIKKGADGQGDFMKAWESFSPNLDIDQKGNEIIARKDDALPPRSGKKIKVTSIGKTWVAIVNAALARSNVRESELGAFLQDVLRAPINDAYKNKVKFNNSRLLTSNEEGRAQISGAGLLSEYIGECMKLYNETDGVEDILVINPSDGHFEIINALDNAGIESKVQSGAIQTSTTWIDFDDPQMLATPQLGTITPK